MHGHLSPLNATDPPADNIGDPLGKRGLKYLPIICYPNFFKGDVTVR